MGEKEMTSPNADDGKKVTNRERAIKLYQEKILPSSNPNSAFARERKVESIMEIERALDDAEKRGFDTGYENGLSQGQKEMRDRASDICEKYDGWKPAEEIRALPIQGETVDGE